MGDVEKSDQLAANHRAACKSLKWYKKLFFYLLDLTLVNCYCVCLVSGHHLSFLDFRLQLVRELLFDEPCPSTDLSTILHCPTIPASLAATFP